MILDEIFKFLNGAGLVPNHAIFSTEYLGHSPRYYDYLRCSGKQPSVRSLVRVTARLQNLARDRDTASTHSDCAHALSYRVMSSVIERCR
jgi:hypothetical protein